MLATEVLSEKGAHEKCHMLAERLEIEAKLTMKTNSKLGIFRNLYKRDALESVSSVKNEGRCVYGI